MKEEDGEFQSYECKSKKDSEREDKNFEVIVATNQTSTTFKEKTKSSVTRKS